ncbi:hypothetical protein J1605_018719 [Eschrichtius robustus]|uniref:Uncharacterized protein n=1 Tax=Eschrichtius robustus TaxID=9764 RepID=A0AB34HTU1_ESCRO|nr:hypothetical protein J1605_018719 [Eschrichtius robustus]
MVGSAPFQGHDQGRAGAEPRPPGAGSLPPPFFADRSATRYCPPRPPDGPLGALKTRPAAAVAAGGAETGETEPRDSAPTAGQSSPMEGKCPRLLTRYPGAALRAPAPQPPFAALSLTLRASAGSQPCLASRS